MYSLTGFGKCVLERGDRKITCELKSVNHRFLDLSFRMPKLFNMAEDTMRKAISAKIARGHVDVFVAYEDKRGDKEKITVNESVAALYVNAAEILSSKFKFLKNDLTISTLLRTQDCISVEMQDDDDGLLLELILETLGAALEQLLAMRKNEGNSLFEDISARLAAMKNALNEITALAPIVVVEYAAKLKKRIAEMLGDVAVDETKLINEVAFFSDKCNIDEEITRLSAHLSNAAKYLIETEPIGRKMDFLVQEMNREINTIGSKAQDITITNLIVFLKNELEKIREQVQNIE